MKILHGNCMAKIKELDDNSIDCVVSSPPYFGLRDYGVEGQDEFIYRSAYENQDAEHRLFYVGTTRAKENLYIMQPTSDYYYTIGDPII